MKMDYFELNALYLGIDHCGNLPITANTDMV